MNIGENHFLHFPRECSDNNWGRRFYKLRISSSLGSKNIITGWSFTEFSKNKNKKGALFEKQCKFARHHNYRSSSEVTNFNVGVRAVETETAHVWEEHIVFVSWCRSFIYDGHRRWLPANTAWLSCTSVIRLTFIEQPSCRAVQQQAPAQLQQLWSETGRKAAATKSDNGTSRKTMTTTTTTTTTTVRRRKQIPHERHLTTVSSWSTASTAGSGSCPRWNCCKYNNTSNARFIDFS